MTSTKYEGTSYPIHFLKITGNIIMINFLKGSAVQLLGDEMIIMHCLLQKKQNIHSMAILSSK